MMEYSPMLVVMLWALTPSDATSVAAHVEEVPTPGMTVHQESYFTFNHGKPFLAEQDPLTGAILNLKTTPVVAPTDDYAYDEEDEEPDGVDRKDGPKIYTRNDIIQPSKDPDLHKFLNLPVHYSTSGKFPLISSSYANTKVQGHSASAQSNHRLTATSSTSTVSPSYYPLKTSATTSVTSTSTSTTTTTTTTTPKPSPSTTLSTTSTTTKPPPSYEYEYEYEYDREPESDKRTTTQKILDFFDKDYAFLGASEEEKPTNNSKVEYVMPSSPAKPPEGTEEESMISPNSNLFIPSDYLKPNAGEKTNETTSNSTQLGNKDPVPQETTLELKKPLNETKLVNTTFLKEQEDSQTKTPEKEEMEKEEFQFGMKITTKSDIETTTPKTEPTSTKPPIKEQRVPFFPTIPPDLRENIYGVSSKPTDLPTKPTQSPIETKATEATTPTIKPTQFHPPLHYLTHDNRPQDLQPNPSGSVENIKPYEPYQRPYLVNSNVPPEMLPPLRPVESPIHKRPIERPTSDTHTYRPVDTFHYSQTRPQNTRPQNNRPIEGIGNKQSIPNEHQRPQQDLRPHEQQRPQQDSRPHEHQRPHQDLRPHEHQRPQQDLRPHEQHQRPQQDQRPHEHHRPSQDMKPHDLQSKPTSPSLQTQRPTDQRPLDNIQRPDVKLPGRPVMSAPPSNRPTDASLLHQSKPYDIPPSYRPDIPQLRPTDAGVHTRPQETPQKPMPQRPLSRPDNRYPPYLPLRPQEGKPEQRPQHIPEYRPLGPRPEEMRPPGIQEFNVALGSRVPEVNKNRPENPTFNNNKYQVQFTQPSKVENHFIKVAPGQENPSYSLQTSFSIGVPPPDEIQGQGSVTSTNAGSSSNKGVGQVLFPDDTEKRPWAHQDEKRPTSVVSEGEKYPRPPWESHLKPPIVFNHVKKDPFPHKRPKPARPDLPNILPQFRPNAKIGHAEPHVYLKTPLDTLQPPPLPRPQFLRAEPPHTDEEMPAHRRNGQTTRVVPIQPIIQNPKRGSLRSEDEKTDPVFVVYPSNNAQDGVVVGTRGPQRPLPPDNLDMEDSFPLDTNKNFQARVDTPILKVKPTKPVIKNEFPYPLVKPTEVEEKAVTTVTKEYTAFSPTVSPTEKEHDTEINIIPYLQDYMPFATKKPSQDVPKWNVGDDIKPISATLKTQKVEETTIKMDNHKTGETPTPQDFQAPFHASLSAPSQGWSVVRPRPEPEKEEETTTAKITEEQEGKFDIQNFKPQLFGGFKPIIPPIDDKELADHEKEVE